MNEAEKIDRVIDMLAAMRAEHARMAERLDGLVRVHDETRDRLSSVCQMGYETKSRVDRAEAVLKAGKWLFPTISAVISGIAAWLSHTIGGHK